MHRRLYVCSRFFFFFASRGVRQGCPLSPLLYFLSSEVLAANLLASWAIPGLRLPHVSTPLPVVSLYADDATAIALSDTAILEVFDYMHASKLALVLILTWASVKDRG